MKNKNISIVLLLLLTTASFAQETTHHLGIGITWPTSIIPVADAEDVTQTGVGLNLFYLGYTEKGFTVTGSLEVGGVRTNDIVFTYDDVTRLGLYFNYDLGLGYTFILDERKTLSLLGVAGCDYTLYYYDLLKKEGDTRQKITSKALFSTFTIGGDVYFSYRMSENFGLFADLAVRALPAGNVKNEREVEHNRDTISTSNTNKIHGGFRITPKIGLVWRV